MKKFSSVIALVIVLALSVVCFASCDLLNGLLSGDDDANKVTVSWYQGSNLLKEEKVEKGSKLTPWTPEVEGKTFTGWYAEASLAQEFDFEQTIEADTDIFAAFKSDEHVEDTTSYYLIGAGSGDMSAANWNHDNAAANLTMTKEDVAGANIYTITIEMYAGDMFQICYGGGWDGQVGIGLMEGAEYCDGVNFYDNATYTAADKKVAQVKNAAGEVVFIGSDEYNKGFEVWNIKLAPGMDGVYKFTYTTYPANKGYNVISFELVEKLEAQEVTHEMYLIGSFNNWSASDADYAMTESSDKKTWTASLKVTEDMYVQYDDMEAPACAFKVFNGINGAYLSPDGNNICLTAGTYVITFTVEGELVSVQQVADAAYYIVGTFVDADGALVNFAVKEGVTPTLTVVDGVASIDFTTIDVSAVKDYNWMEGDVPGSIMAVKVVYGSEAGVENWYGIGEGGGNNIHFTEMGTYHIELDIATGTVTYELVG
jgi:hypothetical protein